MRATASDIAKYIIAVKAISVQTMEEYFAKKAQDNVDSGNYSLNPELAKSIEDSKKGIGVHHYSSWDEMVAKIQQEIKEEENVSHSKNHH